MAHPLYIVHQADPDADPVWEALATRERLAEWMDQREAFIASLPPHMRPYWQARPPARDLA
ncbi:MAG: hypothetical protein AAGK79_13315 [Pseudomonadota bacterium]